MPGTNGNRQHPCSVCGTPLQSDDMYDVIMYQREPREYRRSPRSTIDRYLPPNRTTIHHLYLCKECGRDMDGFISSFEEV